MKTSICPNCNHEQEKEIKRKTKCKDCGKEIFIRNKTLVTKEQSIVIDAKKRMSGGYIQDLDIQNSETLEELLASLNKSTVELIRKKKFNAISNIYLHIGVIKEAEGKYKDCILNYLLSGHYSAQNEFESHKKTGSKLTYKDLVDSNMFLFRSETVTKSLKNLNSENIDINQLTNISVNISRSATEKIDMFKEIIDGKDINYKIDIDKVLVDGIDYKSEMKSYFDDAYKDLGK